MAPLTLLMLGNECNNGDDSNICGDLSRHSYTSRHDDMKGKKKVPIKEALFSDLREASSILQQYLKWKAAINTFI